MQSEEIFSEICHPDSVKFVKDVINKMEYDPVVGPILMDVLNKNQAETRGFVAWAAKKLQAKNYLEIGTRRGWSAGVVVAAVPECEVYCFDIWEHNYSSVPNPGPAFVSSEMKKLGYQKEVHFVTGDSHQTVPKFFVDHPGMEFDLILVDGDHTVHGAWDDLKNTMPHVAKGGMLVFDDIYQIDGLLGVFNQLKTSFPNFEYHAYTKNIPGVGLAIRTE